MQVVLIIIVFATAGISTWQQEHDGKYPIPNTAPAPQYEVVIVDGEDYWDETRYGGTLKIKHDVIPSKLAASARPIAVDQEHHDVLLRELGFSFSRLREEHGDSALAEVTEFELIGLVEYRTEHGLLAIKARGRAAEDYEANAIAVHSEGGGELLFSEAGLWLGEIEIVSLEEAGANVVVYGRKKPGPNSRCYGDFRLRYDAEHWRLEYQFCEISG